MDAVTSFSSLVESVPSWHEQVTQLASYTSQKHEEFKAEYNRLLSEAKPRRKKSPSMCSIRTDDDVGQHANDAEEDSTPSTPQPPNLADISPFEAGNRYIYAQATKKRKPGTSFRSGASGPIKFRSKQMVVIYYDSYVQEQLDSLVKSIGASRNNLRKGKMAYTLSKGLSLPTLGRKYDLPSTVPGLESIRTTAALRNPSKLLGNKDGMLFPPENNLGAEAAFKQADKDLEICQNLCETAAHQFLRDGDCKLELDTVIQTFSKVSETARTTLALLQSEEKASKKEDQSFTEDASIDGSTHTSSDATTLVEKSSREILNAASKLGPSSIEPNLNLKISPITSFAATSPTTMDIEVDDDDNASSIEIDLDKIRSARRAGARRVQA